MADQDTETFVHDLKSALVRRIGSKIRAETVKRTERGGHSGSQTSIIDKVFDCERERISRLENEAESEGKDAMANVLHEIRTKWLEDYRNTLRKTRG